MTTLILLVLFSELQMMRLRKLRMKAIACAGGCPIIPAIEQPSTLRAKVEKLAEKVAYWTGTLESIALHNALFLFSFLCMVWYPPEVVNSWVTNIVSIEAIELSLFVQMSINVMDRLSRQK